MKLRLKGNSIRLRLTQGEVERLGSGGVVEETVEFGDGKPSFKYSIAAIDTEEVTAEYVGGRISVRVPARAAIEWAASEEVGMGADQGGLRVLIEKDFACLKVRPGEDDPDAFPNPEAGQC